MKFSTNPRCVQVDVVLANRKEVVVMDVRELLANLPPLRLLVEYDEAYRNYVAHCLDTDAVATGTTPEETVLLIKQVLENDIAIAIRTKGLESLLHTSAPADVQIRWLEAKAASPATVRTIELEIPSTEEGVQPRRGVQSEIRFGNTKQKSVA